MLLKHFRAISLLIIPCLALSGCSSNSTTDPSPTPSAAPAPVFPIGSTQDDYGISTKIYNFDCPDNNLSLFGTPQGMYCSIEVQLTNTLKKPQPIYWRSLTLHGDPFYLEDSQGRLFGTAAIMYAANTLLPSNHYYEDLQPGLPVIYYVPFDVPIADKIVAAIYKGDWSNSPQLRWTVVAKKTVKKIVSSPSQTKFQPNEKTSIPPPHKLPAKNVKRLPVKNVPLNTLASDCSTVVSEVESMKSSVDQMAAGDIPPFFNFHDQQTAAMNSEPSASDPDFQAYADLELAFMSLGSPIIQGATSGSYWQMLISDFDSKYLAFKKYCP
jgi:uncharacterized protein YceK